jgi:pheromone a factor receptor
MAATSAVLSFTCAALIAVFLLAQRIRASIPQIAIVVWLGGYNLVHGINALVWAGNTDIHIPVWCDIGKVFVFITK